jgi:hypothetical protein
VTRLAPALTAVLLAIVLAAGALAQPAEDEWVGLLVMARDRLDADIAQLDGELAAIAERTESDDWYVMPDPRQGHEGEFVEIDLRDIDGYGPLARLIAGQPSPLAVRLLATLSTADPRAWTAVSLLIDMDAVREGRSQIDVNAQVPSSRRQSADERQSRYAEWKKKVQDERDIQAQLRADIQAELDALGRTAGTAEARSLWDGCWDTPWGQLRLVEDVGGHVAGTLEWVDADGDKRQAWLGLDPLIGDYPDRLTGTLLGGPPTDGIVCPTEVSRSTEWASGRIDYSGMSGRVFDGSFIPCGDSGQFAPVPFGGTWASTLDECLAASEPDATIGDESPLARWEGRWPTNRGVLTLMAEADQLIGEFDSGADGALAGAQVVLVPEQEDRFFAIGRWSATDGPFECAEEFEVEPGYWGEIWLSLGMNESLFGGFNHCSKRGGGPIIVD